MTVNGYDFAMEKTAGIFNALKGMGSTMKNVHSQIGKNLSANNIEDVKAGQEAMLNSAKAAAGMGTSAILGGWGVKQIIDKIMNDNRRKALLEDLMMTDPIIKDADEDKVKEYYATIHHMAPKLSADKNVVRELLQNFIKFGRVDIQSIKSLADTQKSMQQGAVGIKDLKI